MLLTTIILIYLLGVAVSFYIEWKVGADFKGNELFSWVCVFIYLFMGFCIWLSDLRDELNEKKEIELREQEKLKRQPKPWTKGTIYFNQK